MKKVITICFLVATLLSGGMTIDAKTTKKSKAKTSSSKKSSRPAGAIAFVSIQNGGKLYLMKNGDVKIIPASWDRDGEYTKENGAYIFTWGSGVHGDNQLSVIYGNTMYQIIDSYYDDEGFWDYLGGNGWNLDESVGFNASTQTLIYDTTSGTKSVRLSNIPSSDRRSVTWY